MELVEVNSVNGIEFYSKNSINVIDSVKKDVDENISLHNPDNFHLSENDEFYFPSTQRTYVVKYNHEKKGIILSLVPMSHGISLNEFNLTASGFSLESSKSKHILIQSKTTGAQININVFLLKHLSNPLLDSSILCIGDIRGGDGQGGELWNIVDNYIAQLYNSDFIIGKLSADKQSDQSRLEQAKRNRGYRVDVGGRAVKFLTQNAEGKYNLFAQLSFLDSNSDTIKNFR